MCSKFTVEHPCRSVISIKLQNIFIEITFRNGCSSENLLYIFTAPFPRNTSEELLLELQIRIFSFTLHKICLNTGFLSENLYSGIRYAMKRFVIFQIFFQKQSSRVALQKRCWPTTFSKDRLLHRCFPVNFAIFLITPFFTENL